MKTHPQKVYLPNSEKINEESVRRLQQALGHHNTKYSYDIDFFSIIIISLLYSGINKFNLLFYFNFFFLAHQLIIKIYEILHLENAPTPTLWAINNSQFYSMSVIITPFQISRVKCPENGCPFALF